MAVAVRGVVPFFGGRGFGLGNAGSPADCATTLDRPAAKKAIAAAAKISVTAVAMRRGERERFRVSQSGVFIVFLARINELKFGRILESETRKDQDDNFDFGHFVSYFFRGSAASPERSALQRDRSTASIHA